MKLSDLHATDPYKGFNPSRYPEDLHGWDSEAPVFWNLIDQVQPDLIIEVGSWKGASAIHMAKRIKEWGLDTKIVCVDTWLGSLEMWKDKSDPTRYQSLRLKNGYPQLYYTFLANVVRAGMQDVIIPFPCTSVIAARWFAEEQVKADMVYIDASHDFEDVFADMSAYWTIAETVMFGDDLPLPGVKAAVEQFSDDMNLTVQGNWRHWEIWK